MKFEAEKLAVEIIQYWRDDHRWSAWNERFKAMDDLHRVQVWGLLNVAYNYPELNITMGKVIHKHFSELILEAFKVPMGDAGIGVKPTPSPEVEAWVKREK